MKTELEKFFTVDQVSEALAVSTRTVFRLIKAGELLAYRIGRSVRIADADLQAFLNRRR